jgi:tetratricopeptide (TPR) repeat protein
MTDQPGSRPRLSVATIVRDSEHLLADTLQSVREIADEIVVCDTGSTDQSVEVAARLATRVAQYCWSDDFAAARNACLEHVTGDWVLWLDAGERLDHEDAVGLRGFINSCADPACAYLLVVKVPPPNEHVAAEQVGQVRLVPNHPKIRFRGRVRETLTESLSQAGITVEGLKCDIHRSRREHEPEVKVFKARRNLRLCELARQDDGPQTRLLNCQAEAHTNLNNRTEAAKLYREAIKTADRGSADMLEAYYGLLTALDGVPDAVTAQISVCLEALEVYPFDAQLLCALGGYLQQQGRTDLATRSFETAYKFGQVNPETWHLQEIVPFVAVCYSAALQLSDRDEEASDVLAEAAGRDPQSLRLHRQIVELHIKHGRTEDALAQLGKWPVRPDNVEALRMAVRGACLAGQKNWPAARSYLQTAFTAGCRDVLCLRWLSITLLSVGQFEEAEPILQQWTTIDPVNVEPRRYLAAVETARAPQTPAASDADAAESGQTSPPSPDLTSRRLRIDEVEPGAGHQHKPSAPAETSPDLSAGTAGSR